MGEIVKLLERKVADDRNEKLHKQAEKRFRETLEKLWLSISNEKPN
jgi:hypothetical protein